MSGASRWLLLLAAFAAVAGIGIVDDLLGPAISLVLLYLVPVVISGWLLGARFAATVGVAATFVGLAADVAYHAPRHVFISTWNASARLTIFVAIGVMTAWIRRDHERLNRLLRRETIARAATLEQLRHRDRLAMVGQLASGIAHELGTPMNVISGRAEFVVGTPGVTPEVEGHARIIIDQAERVSQIIRQLLDFARRSGPNLGSTDLTALARSALDLFQPIADKQGIVLGYTGGPEPCRAHVDATQIQQALGNLIVNSVRATPAGGQVEIAVGRRRMQPPPDFGSREGSYVFVSIEDTGAGIPPEHVERIFEPFFTTRPPGEGTGLGLSVTYGIVRDHGGWIDVQSEPGKGSRFTIFLPEGPLAPGEERAG